MEETEKMGDKVEFQMKKKALEEAMVPVEVRRVQEEMPVHPV